MHTHITCKFLFYLQPRGLDRSHLDRKRKKIISTPVVEIMNQEMSQKKDKKKKKQT